MSRRRRYAGMTFVEIILWVFLLGVLIYAVLVEVGRVHAQPPAPVCNVDAPEREFRTCIAMQAAAGLEQRAIIGRLEGVVTDQARELKQLRADLATRPTAQQVADVAWQKATERLFLWQQQSTAYTDKWFYDEVYKRWRTHECRNGTPPTVGCP